MEEKRWNSPVGFGNEMGYRVYDGNLVVALIPEQGMKNVPENIPTADEAYKISRLVQAAPELLAAAKAAFRMLEALTEGSADPEILTAGLCKPLLRAVIAKAEGQE